MILLIHKDDAVVEVIDLDTNKSIPITTSKIINELFNVALVNVERVLVWCHESLREYLNIEGLKTSFHLKNMMISYGHNQYFSDRIGYIEDSPFLKVNKSVKYPTWLMSSQVGAIYASQFLIFQDEIKLNETFDFVLNAIAKQGMPKGLFCYSEPNLLKNNAPLAHSKSASNFQLFKFVKLHYKGVWSSLLLLNIIINEGSVPIWSFIRNLFKRHKKTKLKFSLEPFIENTSNKSSTIDIIIPTIGRKKYLHDVLIDLSNQTMLPKKVIVVEQNKIVNGRTELDYIKNKAWPFIIEHKLINKTGACNARNLALKEVTSDFVFFADDDIRFEANLLSHSINFMHKNNLSAITLSCLRKNEVEVFKTAFQWSSFGSGCSIVKRKVLNKVAFNLAYEHGFSEDADFGMQLRNSGIDVVYFQKEKITHLKAPVGGFRVPYINPWQKEEGIQPKPSPTVMLNRLNNSTPKQLLGYRTKLFFKYYKVQRIKNPIAYYKLFKKQWEQSIYWANILKEQDK